MEALAHALLTASIVASVEEYNPNVGDDEIPKSVFDRTLTTVTIGEIFRKDENDYINIETTSDREHTNKKYRIPKHQRHNKWNTDDKKNLIDSVWKNYIIGGISLSQHPDGRLVYFNIEDSQSRLTVIQEYLDDKLKYKNKFFSELTNDEKHRFHNYTFSVDTTIPTNHAIQNESITTIDDHYYENFDRINRGKKLEDNDKYWCHKDKSVVNYAINLIDNFNNNYTFMNTHDFNGDTERKPLNNVVTMIGALIYGTYKNSYERHYENIGIPITDEMNQKVINFMNYYMSIRDGMFNLYEKEANEKFQFNNPGQFLGMILYDYNEKVVDDATQESSKNMWIEILNINRFSDNFMKGKKTIWNGFTDGDRKNQEVENIEMRYSRVKEFYENKVGVSSSLHIEYTEP